MDARRHRARRGLHRHRGRPDRRGRRGAGAARRGGGAAHRRHAGCLATPGLVNCHHHLYQWATRGAARRSRRSSSGSTTLYPVWARIDAQDVRRRGARRPGRARASRAARPRPTTTTSSRAAAGDLLEAEIEAARELGLRFHPCRGSMDLGRSQGGLPPDEVVEDRDAILAATEAAIDRWHDPSPGSMLRIALAPCSPFSVTAELMRESARAGAPPRRAAAHPPGRDASRRRSSACERFGCGRSSTSTTWAGSGRRLARALRPPLAGRDRAASRATGTGVGPLPDRPTRASAPASRPAPTSLAAGAPGRPRRRRRRLERGRRAGRRAAPGAARGAPARRPGGADGARRRSRSARSGGARCLGREDEIGSLEPGKLRRRRAVAHGRPRPRGHRRPRRGAGARPAAPSTAAGQGAPGRRRRRRSSTRSVGAIGHAADLRDIAEWSRMSDATRTDPRAAASARACRAGRRRPQGARASSRTRRDLWRRRDALGRDAAQPAPARARSAAIDIAGALAVPGVHAVLTHEDVPGRKTLRHGDRRPAGAGHRARCATRASRSRSSPPTTPRPRAAPRPRSTSTTRSSSRSPTAEAALDRRAPQLHPGGNLLRHVPIRHGDPDATAEVVVRGEYEVGMQDQAFLGPESGLAVPAGDGGVDLYIATQWLHVDQDQLAASLGLPPERVRLHLAGVGGAFGGREDLSMQVHACMLALHTGRPVKMVVRARGVVLRPRPPASGAHAATSTAPPRDGRLVYVKARIVLDGGAYASSVDRRGRRTRPAFACGPYEVPERRASTPTSSTPNNPPCGAMRGFGAVQACFAYESQMDRLAAALGMDPVELRIRNAHARRASRMPTGQVVAAPAPVRRAAGARCATMPLPPQAAHRAARPARAAGRRLQHDPRRGRPARRRLRDRHQEHRLLRGLRRLLDRPRAPGVVAGGPQVEVHTAAAEVGQGLVTVQEQIARTELGRGAASSSCPPTRPSARPARPRPRARPG